MKTNEVSRPVLRKLLAIVLACLIATLAYFAMVSTNLLARVTFAGFAATIAINWVLQFRKERLILLKPAGSVGTVLERSRLGHKRGVRIRYEFIAADGKRYTGAITGSVLLAQLEQQIDILYRCHEPTHNLPRRRFWLHEL
jgi:hypothetical protein